MCWSTVRALQEFRVFRKLSFEGQMWNLDCHFLWCRNAKFLSPTRKISETSSRLTAGLLCVILTPPPLQRSHLKKLKIP